MRIRILFFLLLAVSIFSCNSKEQSFKPSPPDTLRTIVAYEEPNGLRGVVFAYRINLDTIKIFRPDSSKAVPILIRESFYYFPKLFNVTDSLGKPKVDAQKKPLQEEKYVPEPKRKIIRDFNVDVDTLLKIKTVVKTN